MTGALLDQIYEKLDHILKQLHLCGIRCTIVREVTKLIHTIKEHYSCCAIDFVEPIGNYEEDDVHWVTIIEKKQYLRKLRTITATEIE